MANFLTQYSNTLSVQLFHVQHIPYHYATFPVWYLLAALAVFLSFFFIFLYIIRDHTQSWSSVLHFTFLLFNPSLFCFLFFVHLDSIRYGGMLEYSPHALPLSAGQPLPMPRIYLVSVLVVYFSSLFDLFHFCVLSVPPCQQCLHQEKGILLETPFLSFLSFFFSFLFQPLKAVKGN